MASRRFILSLPSECWAKDMTVDYEYYTGVYGGNRIPREDFGFCEKRAAALVDMITCGRASQAGTDEVNMAVCAAAEVCFSEDAKGAVQSERVGDYSVSYMSRDENSAGGKLRRAVAPYLLKTGLMSRAV
ncbi:MAG: hypothetical protein IKS19_03280 [Clostridia bacterium]|nr:hypothetical protein [Clostridia bacterium]